MIKVLQMEAIALLKTLIATPSFSKEEHQTAEIINFFLTQNGVQTHRKLNNVWAFNKHFDKNKKASEIQEKLFLEKKSELIRSMMAMMK